MKVEKFASSEGNVWKYVFHFDGQGKSAIAEAVLYKYDSFKKRAVMCVSVQCGCPVGCTFCGTGKNFIRNLDNIEIVGQVKYLVNEILSMEGTASTDIEKFQIMFMSMGEPMLNFDNVYTAVTELNWEYPNAQLLLSTIGIKNQSVLDALLTLSHSISKLGLQFSIHQAFESKRDSLIPFKNKMTLREIRNYGLLWNKRTLRPVYLNYCVDGNNISNAELDRLKDLFPPHAFNFTFSVVCSADETMKDAGFRNINTIEHVTETFLEEGYNVRVFDPAGQDDIRRRLWTTLVCTTMDERTWT